MKKMKVHNFTIVLSEENNTQLATTFKTHANAPVAPGSLATTLKILFAFGK